MSDADFDAISDIYAKYGYANYINKAERKNRTKEEVDEIICWLTGYSNEELVNELEKNTDFQTFFANAPSPNPSRFLIKGVVCGVRAEEVEDPIMREIRYLDKMVDELAKGKKWRRFFDKVKIVLSY